MSLLGLLAWTPSAGAQTAPPRLAIHRPAPSDGWVRLSSSFHSNGVLSLEASRDLVAWQPIGTLHEALFEYPDAAAAGWLHRFYRLSATPRGPDDDWKNQLLYPVEAFRSPAAGASGLPWVKFAILLDEPGRVYYQDSTKYPFHYDFAVRRLGPCLGLDRLGFEAISEHRAQQQVVLGTVLYPPGGGIYPQGTDFAEYGVQFVGQEAYSAEEIARWFELVKATVHAPDGAEAFYMPVFEQIEAARTNGPALAALGVPVASLERWVSANSCYAAGWAVGRLRYFAGGEIAAAYGDGRLRGEDILLTDGVPAETPLVAGIISLTPSTPNSHTAILAASFGIPFVYLPDAGERERVRQLEGHRILLRAVKAQDLGQVKVLDLEGVLEPAFEAELLALKAPEPIVFPPKRSWGALSAPTDSLVPADSQFFGGKAANYGLLWRAIPTHCQPAVAFSFDLWDAFLDQTLPSGLTLRAEIAARLAPFTHYPPDIPALKTNLAAVRDLFTRTANFTPAQQQAIVTALGTFNPNRKIRFRSSTNVEDAEHFTGAGLYDSFSGCLLDELDSDNVGPCQCDPAEPNERGVFRALRKVYASFYNDKAFLERLCHAVDETQAGMGVLVHYSFPDEEELANGVGTMTFGFTPKATNLNGGDLVTQLGAVSVTNPDGSAVPELVHANRSGTNYTLTLKQTSSRVPLAATVLEWRADYENLLDLMGRVAGGFRELNPARSTFYLDFEYKKDARLGLMVKQVRPIPQPGTTNPVTPFLLPEPADYEVLQFGSDVFANHRLKVRLSLRTRGLRLAETNLLDGLYTEGACEYLEDGVLRTLQGAVRDWPQAAVGAAGAANSWVTGQGDRQRLWRLDTTVVTAVSNAQLPVFTQTDFSKRLSVTYASPVPTIVGITKLGQLATTTNEAVTLRLCSGTKPAEVLQQRLFRTNQISIETSFTFPQSPVGILAPTSPLLRFVTTRIAGLTSEPIVLTNYYSQSYGGFSHNYFERFLFEPALESGLPPATLAELHAANIQLIYLRCEAGHLVALYLLGADPR